MKTFTYFSFTEATYQSLVSANCPKLAEKFNAKGSSTFDDEDGNKVTTNWDYTWADLLPKIGVTPIQMWYMPKQVVQEELLDEEGNGTGVMVDVEKYVVESVPAPTEEDPNATVDQYVKHKLFIARLPEVSNLAGELRELKNLGSGMEFPMNTVLTLSEYQELIKLKNVFHKNDNLPTI